ALIIVLSVMNGFQKEVRDRMLGVVSHIEIFSRDGQALQQLDEIMAAARKHPEVVGAAPFINTQALIARGEDMKGTIVRGIDPKLEPEVTDINGIASKGTFD
ncbi:lipoprotein-releasing system transmembrane subunit LolC, partial [Mycobacterium tuberculosis]